MKLLKFDADKGYWIRFNSEAEFYQKYPLPKHGEYHAQPHETPYAYPCYIQEITYRYINNGPDEIILAFIYNFDEGTEQEEMAFAIKHCND